MTVSRYKWTITGFILMLFLWGCIAKFNLDIFEALTDFLNGFERYELNDLLLPVLIFYTFTMADLFRRHEVLQVETEKLKLYRKMVEAVYHIMNDFLQKMLAFKMTAEETRGFNPKALKLYDQIIQETDDKIQALGSLEKPDEELIEETISPATGDQHGFSASFLKTKSKNPIKSRL